MGTGRKSDCSSKSQPWGCSSFMGGDQKRQGSCLAGSLKRFEKVCSIETKRARWKTEAGMSCPDWQNGAFSSRAGRSRRYDGAAVVGRRMRWRCAVQWSRECRQPHG
jgi:hypothetical protein